VEVTAVGFGSYLGLNEQVLEGQRLAGSVQVLWARMPSVSMRIAMLLAPLGTAWGMQFRLHGAAHEATDALVGSDAVAVALRGSIEALGFQVERLPASLLESRAFGRAQRLCMGSEAGDIPHAAFRAILVPDDESEFFAFLSRLQDHIDQLGKFFLLPVPLGVDLQRWQYEEDIRLTELLSGRPGGLKKGQSTQGWEGAIRQALESLDASDAEQWLTPAFLEYEQVKTGYPIRKEGVIVTALAAAFLAMMKMRPIGEQLASRNAVTMLKLQLIKKWRWPLGLRQLHNAQNSPHFREAMLKGEASCEVAEALVREILTEGRRRYPVLFG